jgi:hypothetical protein
MAAVRDGRESERVLESQSEETKRAKPKRDTPLPDWRCLFRHPGTLGPLPQLSLALAPPARPSPLFPHALAFAALLKFLRHTRRENQQAQLPTPGPEGGLTELLLAHSNRAVKLDTTLLLSC